MVNELPSESGGAAPTPMPRALKTPPGPQAEQNTVSPTLAGKPIPIPVTPVESSLATRIGIVAGSVAGGLAAIGIVITLLSLRTPTSAVPETPANMSDAPRTLAAVDNPMSESTTSTTERQRSSNRSGQATVPALTTTTIETAQDRDRVDAFRIAADGTMDRLANIENHTIRELGEGMCSVASGVTSADGFSVMAELIWVGMGQDTRATYFDDSTNFVASSRSALQIYCPALSDSLFPA